MAHNYNDNGTVYEIGGGKVNMNGTVYEIDHGKYNDNGTVYELSFGNKQVIKITVASSIRSYHGTRFYVQVNGSKLPVGTTEFASEGSLSISVHVKTITGLGNDNYNKVILNGSIKMQNSGTYTFSTEASTITVDFTASGASGSGTNVIATITTS